MLAKAIAGSVVVACVAGMSVPASAALEADLSMVHASSSADRTYVGSATFHVGEGFSESVRLINGRADRNSVMERVALEVILGWGPYSGSPNARCSSGGMTP